MANTETTFTLKFKTENDEIIQKSVTTLKEVKQSVKDLESELEGTDFGSEQWQNLTGELGKSKTALADISNAQAKASKSTQSLGQQFASIPGPIGMVSQSVIGLGTALKALIANPIGAVIAAIGAVFIGLYKAINSTEEGTFKFKQAFAALSGILDPVLKLLGQIGVILIDGILAGINAVQDGLAFLGFDSFAKASDDAENLAKSINEVEDAEGELEVARAQQNKQLAEAREIISDTNVSLAERKKALQDVKKSEEDLAKKEVELSQKRLANVREELRLKGKTKELLDAEEQALIKLANTQQAQAAVNRKNIKAEQALEREAEAEKKKRAEDAKARNEKAIADRKALQSLELQLNLDLIVDEQEKAIKSAEIAYQKQLTDINNLVATTTKKNDLREKAEELHLRNIAKIEKGFTDKKIKEDDDAKKAAEDKIKADEENAKNQASAAIQREIQKIDTLMALDEMNYEEGRIRSEEDLEYSISLLDRRLQAELSNTELTNEQKLLLQKQYDGKAVALTKARTQQERDLERAKLQGLADGFANISQIVGEQSAVGKAAAVASATINAYLSASQAYAATVGIPVLGPILAPIAAAAAVVAGLKSVREILAVPEPDTTIQKPKFALGGIVQGQGSIDNVSAMLSPGESVINAASTSAFPSLLSTINQIGGGRSFDSNAVLNSTTQDRSGSLISALNGNGSQPIRAYVVSGEIETQAAFDRTVQSRSTL